MGKESGLQAKDFPPWAKLLFTDASEWSKSKEDNRIQINRYDFLKEVSPGLYDAAGEEIKEFNQYHRLNGNSFDKVKLGRRICSIPMADYVLHPELGRDPKALAKYLELHPECRAERFNKNGKLANGIGFSLTDQR